MIDPIAARTPATSFIAATNLAQTAEAASANLSSGFGPAVDDRVSDALKKLAQANDIVTTLANGEATIKAADKAEKLAEAKQQLAVLKMIAEMAVASGNTRLAKAVAEQVSAIAKQLGGMGGGGAAPLSSSSASSSSSSASSSPVSSSSASSSSSSSSSSAANGSSDSGDDVQSLLALAKKIIDILRRFRNPSGKLKHAIDKAEQDVTVAQAATDTATMAATSAPTTTGTGVNVTA